MQVIGLCGYAGSGKDTAAQGLIELGWQRVSFADPIREMALAINPYVQVPRKRHWMSWYENWLCGPYICTPLAMALWWDARGSWDTLKKISPDVRGLLQRIGTEAVREIIGYDTWVNLAFKRICDAMQLHDPPTGFIITDLRFENELKLLKNLNAKFIRITRPGIGPVNEHQSDQLLASFQVDHEIMNDGDVAKLQAALVAIARGE